MIQSSLWPKNAVSMIKLAVDVERGLLAGGGELHSDCEQVLLEDGSKQENIIEWSAPQAPEETIVDLALMQRELVLWRRIWPTDAVRPLLTHRAHTIADALLAAAGYYAPDQPSE